MNGIRLAVLDDGLFVRTDTGTVHPMAATFHRFVETVAGVGGFARTRYLIPVRQLRDGEAQPILNAVNEELLEIVPTAWFSGIADYLARSAYLFARNWRPISRTIRESDLVWLRLPASNALLALSATRRSRVPHFGWLAGSVREVAEAQRRPHLKGLAARATGNMYDAISRYAERGGPMVHLDGEMFASVTTAAEVEESRSRTVAEGPPWRIAWAGRMAGEKGLLDLLAACDRLMTDGIDLTLTLIGDGPQRGLVEERSRRLPAGTVTLAGHIGDRRAYLDLVRDAHVCVHPSGAEGVPKVLVEAMAAGVPVVAADVGGIAGLLGGGERGRLVPAGDPLALADAIRALLHDPAARDELRGRGLAWASDHTAERQALKLVDWMRDQFPQLAW